LWGRRRNLRHNDDDLLLRRRRSGAADNAAQDACSGDGAPIRAAASIAGRGWGYDRKQQDNDQQLFQLEPPVTAWIFGLTTPSPIYA
jgi:hypothetical protein